MPPNGSQLDAAPTLPLDLSQVEDAPAVPAASTMGVYTAARFFMENPRLYKAIARAQAEGASDRQCARIFSVHHETVRAIRAREAGSATDAEYRRRITASLRGGVVAIVDELQDRLANNPGAVSTRDLVAALRELNGAERVHAGAPSSIVGVIRAEGATATLEELLRQAADARGIGLAEEKAGPREAGEVVEVVDAQVREPVAGLLGETSADGRSHFKCVDSSAQVIEISTERPEVDSRLESSGTVGDGRSAGSQDDQDGAGQDDGDGAAGQADDGGERRAEEKDAREHGGGGGAAQPGGSFQADP